MSRAQSTASRPAQAAIDAADGPEGYPDHLRDEEFDPINGGLPSDHVYALAQGADGALWIGTVGGLARLDKDGRWQTYTQANTKGGLPSDHVYALAQGADGVLWIGTEGGLARLDKDGRWQTYNGANGSLPNDDVQALHWRQAALRTHREPWIDS